MIERVAYLSMHTSPLLQPGTGDAGGMNVYVDQLARAIASRGIEADVFTRRHDSLLPPMVEVAPGYRVFHIDAGPASPLEVPAMARHVRRFASGALAVMAQRPPDVVHSHYWLSGWAGLLAKRRLQVPLANSFHTLGRVKDRNRRADDPPESLLRIAAEHEVIEGAECVVASTPDEAADLIEHYGADPTSLCVSPPGVDHRVFHPGSMASARSRLGLGPGPLVLFAGRIQPLKGVDVVIEAFPHIAATHPDLHLLIVGGPSGRRGEPELDRLRERAYEVDGLGRIRFLDPVPHGLIADLYRAADVVMVPSRTESFGLVAAEAQACGTPVVAAAVGGLGHVVLDGETGRLVGGWDPLDHAKAVLEVLGRSRESNEMAEAAVRFAKRFSWDATARKLLELYRDSLEHAPVASLREKSG
ncbi:MAG TPA: glycosyltransferase [Acidimicrobiia bacterium]